jgi:glycerol kinase
MAQDLILALDQGTTSTRAILFDRAGQPLAEASRPLRQSYPRDGWVEHDAEEIYAACVAVLREASEKSGRADEIAAIGITNQRETVVIWDRKTGRPIHPAVVWQDRRTAEVCAKLKAEGREPRVTEVTGLLLDPYFSGTKIAWILDKVPGARARAEAGDLLAGTMDTWVIWRLTGSAVHATDATNASRTLLFDIGGQDWSAEMLDLFNVPAALLPKVLDCVDDYGAAQAQVLGREVPIRGVAGDQQAALMGQGCVAPGQMKATYGTGCFMLINTGEERPTSRSRLLTTVAARVNGRTTYALEGSIFVAGAAIQWLGEGLGITGGPRARRSLGAGGEGRSRCRRRAGLHRPWRALVGRFGARRDLRPDSRRWPARDRRGDLRLLRAAEPRPDRGHAGRRAGSVRRDGADADRRRHVQERLVLATLGRPHRHAGAPGQLPGDHGPGRGPVRRGRGGALRLGRGGRRSQSRRRDPDADDQGT